MEIDYDYLQTGTAIGFRASHELCSNYLYKNGTYLVIPLNTSIMHTCGIVCQLLLESVAEIMS